MKNFITFLVLKWSLKLSLTSHSTQRQSIYHIGLPEVFGNVIVHTEKGISLWCIDYFSRETLSSPWQAFTAAMFIRRMNKVRKATLIV